MTGMRRFRAGGRVALMASVALVWLGTRVPAHGGTPQGGAVPAGAMELLKKVDEKLKKMDGVMGEEGAKFDKDYRAKTAAALLKEAREAMETVTRRYGAKLGKDHAEVVSRNERIDAAEKAVASFQGAMAEALKKDASNRADRDQAEADAEKARQQKDAQAMADRQEAARKAEAAATQEKVGGGKIVFSKSPINPSAPANLTNRFKAGDTIYGLIQAEKTWRETYNAKGRSELGVMVGMSVNEVNISQYITLKKAEYLDSPQLVLEIAPAPEAMTAYKNPDMVFGEGKGNRKIGPIAFSYELAQLPAGKHVVQFYVRNFGDKPAVGEFEIEGSDFKSYAGLHEKYKAASDAIATLPSAKMVNKALEAQMRTLLDNAGWKQILRVVIVDKDWWIEEGGKSRYLNVAAAAKGKDGQCYWCNLQFTQPKLITGAWGALELTRTGEKRAISEDNIGK